MILGAKPLRDGVRDGRVQVVMVKVLSPPFSMVVRELEGERSLSRDRLAHNRMNLLDLDLGMVEHQQDENKKEVDLLGKRFREWYDEGVKAENKRLRHQLEDVKLSRVIDHMEKDRLEKDLYEMRRWAYDHWEEMVRLGYDDERIMPPKKMTNAEIRKLVADSVAQALAEDRAARANDAGAAGGGTGATGATGDDAGATGAAGGDAGATGAATGAVVRGCTYKQFLGCDPIKFRGTEGAVGLIRWFESVENTFILSKCAEDCKVQYAVGTMIEYAKSWWNSYAQPIGMEKAYETTWTDFKKLATNKFCPRSEIRLLETEFYDLKVKNYDIETYIRRFQELKALCPSMVPDFDKEIEAFLKGLPRSIKGDVTSSNPQTLDAAIVITQKLMAQVVEYGLAQNANNNNNNQHKRKWDDDKKGNNNQGHNNDHHQQNKRQENAKAMTDAPTGKGGYAGNYPYCNRCKKHHTGYCNAKCTTCGKNGHMANDCKGKATATGANTQPIVVCYGCGEKGHKSNNCPNKGNDKGEVVTCYGCGEKGHKSNHCPNKGNDKGGNNRAKAYAMGEQQGPNVVTDTFLLNNHYAKVLFDSGSDKSFVSTSFSALININPIKLNYSYEVELADGKLVSTNTVLRGCTIILANHPFSIDLKPPQKN
ncbi:reverse transcriptase domain-containing protein [Artemisia annua]|uniref:Reverse transcriptase domain-containing protein n=1 Tax=Artemisia annua TaxID=35608 RepID=A0A2U1Q131_ARTAN|nr:reverse transcriptase domain-containing protein [Artemisia annua]